MEPVDLVWLVGFLEGEGSFGCYYYRNGTALTLVIQVGSTDLDVIERAAKLLCTTVTIARPASNARKQLYKATLRGDRAAVVMLLICSRMGSRRKEQITQALDQWLRRPAARK